MTKDLVFLRRVIQDSAEGNHWTFYRNPAYYPRTLSPENIGKSEGGNFDFFVIKIIILNCGRNFMV